MSSNQFFMAIFTVKDAERKLKTISTYVNFMSNFESTIDKYTLRFAQQDYTLMGVVVFSSELDFRHEWREIYDAKEVQWADKNKTLLIRRPDVKESVLFCVENFRLRTYALRQDV